MDGYSKPAGLTTGACTADEDHSGNDNNNECTESDGCAGCTIDGEGNAVNVNGAEYCSWNEDWGECARNDEENHCEKGGEDKDGPPACVAHCNWDNDNCPKDCDTESCTAAMNPSKEQIDSYIAAGCAEDKSCADHQWGNDQDGPAKCGGWEKSWSEFELNERNMMGDSYEECCKHAGKPCRSSDDCVAGCSCVSAQSKGLRRRRRLLFVGAVKKGTCSC